MNQEDKTENITIKGISKEIYGEIKKIAKETGRTIGEITNEAYDNFLIVLEDFTRAGNEFVSSLREGSIKIIENIEEVEITGKEIQSFSKKLIFRNINKLIFKEIGESDIRNYIMSIQNVKYIQIPKEINKFTILERGKFIGKIDSM